MIFTADSTGGDTGITRGIRFVESDILGQSTVDKVKPNTTYTLSFWLKTDSAFSHPGNLVASSAIYAGEGVKVTLDTNRSTAPTLTTSWQKYVLTFKITGLISHFYIMLFFTDCLASTQYRVDISSFKLEEGNIATDWTPSAEDIDQSVKAQISMCVQKDKNNNLVSEINIASNLLTIDTDNFTLAKDGKMTCTGATIKGGTLTSSDGTDNSARLTIAAGTIRRYFNNELLCYYHASVPKSQNRYECLEYTNGLEIVKKQNTPTDIYYSALFDDDGFSLRSNHRSSTPMKVSISSTTDWSYAPYSSALRSIVEADSALIVSANRGNNNLYLEGSEIVMCGQLTLPHAIGADSSTSYVYVVADKKTGQIGYLSA